MSRDSLAGRVSLTNGISLDPMPPKQKAKPKQTVMRGSAGATITTSPAIAAGLPTEGEIVAGSAAGDSAERAAPIFVWVLLGFLFVLHLNFAVRHSFPVPYWDESGYIPYVVGAQPVTFGWLWSQANEHRIPVPRLLYLAVARISGLDARLMNSATVSLLAITACILVVGLRRLQGRTTYVHAFVPLLLLNPAHYSNTVWPNQIGFVLPTCLMCYAILVLAERGEGMGRYLALGPVAFLACMCGANGLPLALALSPMLFWIAVRDFRVGVRWRGFAQLICAASICLYTGLYFVHLKRDTPQMRPWRLSEAIIESVKAVSMSLGPSAETLWPYAAITIVALLIVCTILLIVAILRHPADRLSASGLLLALIGSVGVAVGIGFGRTVLGRGAGFAPRYATLVTPILFAVFIAFTRFGSAAIRRFVQVALFTSMCLVFSMNGVRSTLETDELLADGKVLEREVSQHVSIAQLAAEHGDRWMFRPDIFADNMRLLLNAKTGIYGRYPPDIHRDALSLLSENTEVKGPSTSGQMVRLEDFGLPKGIGLIAHAPHRSSLIIDRHAQSVHVGFGILPGNQSAGVDFRVSLRMPDGSSNVLWSRTLDPVGIPSDAGIKEADIVLTESVKRGSRLVFDTAARPGRDNFACWSFWTAVRVH